MIIKSSTWFVFLYLTFSIMCFSISGLANPIPVYPDPEPTLISYSGGSESFPFVWILLIFIINFCVDVLILYGGLLLLDRLRAIPEEYVLSLSKSRLFTAVGLISLTGVVVEYILGSWVGGLLLAAIVILGSFVFVGNWLLSLSWPNSFRLGGFALLINIVLWIVFYTII